MAPQRTGSVPERTGIPPMADGLHAVEAALYLVLAAGTEMPVACRTPSPAVAECGVRGVAYLQSDGSIVLPGRIRVDRSRSDVIRMSNGVEGRRGSTGWISFSNGLVVRREQGRWRFSGGLICAATAADRGECR